MDIDENDLLGTNEFIGTPQLDDHVEDFNNEEFIKHYEALQKKREKQRIAADIQELEEDPESLLSTNKFTMGASGNIHSGDQAGIERYRKEIRTLVHVDSRDRDVTQYPLPNHFRLNLPRPFTNVKSVRLKSVEFPNTAAVINSNFNHIYWLNQEDIDLDIIDNVTGTYPVYDVELDIGTYSAPRLSSHIEEKLNEIKRQNGIGDFHFFLVDLNIQTDISTFTSLILTDLPQNPFTVTSGLNIITVNAPTHGFTTGDTVYIISGTQIAGIPSSEINEIPHIVTVTNPDEFTFEVKSNAGETVQGGGNNTKSGVEAPFQFLWGTQGEANKLEAEFQEDRISARNTVAQKIGFPLENSFERIDTEIMSVDNYFQVTIVLDSPHGFENTTAFIPQTCTITGTTTTPSINGTRFITRILDATSLNINFTADLTVPSFNSGTLSVGLQTFNIVSAQNYRFQTLLVTTFSPHNYIIETDIGFHIKLFETAAQPDINGERVIDTVLSTTTFTILGRLLTGGTISVTNPGDGGHIPRHDPLTTSALVVTSISTGALTTFGFAGNHDLRVGDHVLLDNVITTPPILVNATPTRYAVNTIPDPTTFTINFTTSDFDVTPLNDQVSLVRTPIVTVSFPFHGFNSIADITNSTTAGFVVIQTTLDHGFTTGNTVRVMETNSTPVIDGGGYAITYLSSDTFEIPFLPALTSSGDSGVIGMTNDFILYSAIDTNGIRQESINGTVFPIREIIDADTFTFIAPEFAQTSGAGGGDNIFISSIRHGFSGIQSNTKNDELNRFINLEGENFAFLCSPQLGTILNTGSVKNIFARVILDQSPGFMVFRFLSDPKDFENDDQVPLSNLSFIEIFVRNYDNTLYEFKDLDHQFCLEIAEVYDTTDALNFSPRRGTTNRDGTMGAGNPNDVNVNSGIRQRI